MIKTISDEEILQHVWFIASTFGSISNRRNLIDVITDPMFAAPSIKTAQAYASNNIPTYFYQVFDNLFFRFKCLYDQ